VRRRQAERERESFRLAPGSFSKRSKGDKSLSLEIAKAIERKIDKVIQSRLSSSSRRFNQLQSPAPPETRRPRSASAFRAKRQKPKAVVIPRAFLSPNLSNGKGGGGGSSGKSSSEGRENPGQSRRGERARVSSLTQLSPEAAEALVAAVAGRVERKIRRQQREDSSGGGGHPCDGTPPSLEKGLDKGLDDPLAALFRASS